MNNSHPLDVVRRTSYSYSPGGAYLTVSKRRGAFWVLPYDENGTQWTTALSNGRIL